ncbi:interleukin-2 receptor subunit beta [Polymixia lowei]
MEILWTTYLLVFFISACPAHSQRSSQGLSCVNDLVNNVSCTWNSSQVDPGADCWVHGTKKTWDLSNFMSEVKRMVRSCNLQPLGSHVRSCSFAFENKGLTCSEVMPCIQVKCNDVLMDNLTNYRPCDHIKMHPPSILNVSTSANETWISWNPGFPHSDFFTDFEFQAQIKQSHQKWQEARTLSTDQQELRIFVQGKKSEHYQFRVRVKPPVTYPDTHWSDWSSTVSWAMPTPDSQVPFIDWTSWLVLGCLSFLTLFIIMLLVLLKTCFNRGFLKGKPVPDPSKYFHTLHSVHKGNFKRWLNAQSASSSFFTAQPCVHISPVEVVDAWDAVASPSCNGTSTAALLHSQPSSPTSDCADCSSSSSSSSGFSNLGYFHSNSPGRPPQMDPSPVYFTYQDDFHNPGKEHALHAALCQPLTGPPSYEHLRLPGCLYQREPQSPDSGFGFGTEDRADDADERRDREKRARIGAVSDDHRDSPLLTLPVHLAYRMCSPSSPAPPPPSQSPTPTPQLHPGDPELECPALASGVSYASWPVGAVVGRSSSMLMKPCNGGYLTVKELQTTYSNKSI